MVDNKNIKNTYLKHLGYRIFNVLNAREGDEFVLYWVKTNKYYSMSKKRINTILYKELGSVLIRDVILDGVKKEEKDKTSVNPKKVLENWIEEEYIIIDSLNYRPEEELIYSEENKTYFNIYNKSKILKEYKQGKNYNFKYIKKVLLNLTGNNKTDFEYVCKWFGWQLQHPTNRLPTSIIFQGEQGTGKTKFCDLVIKEIFASNYSEIGQTEINDKHNVYVKGKQIIMANEVVHNENKYLIPNKLKSLVTDSYLSINEKFKNTYTINNYSHWIFATNNDIPLKIDKDDRRYSVFKSKKLIDGFEIIQGLIDNQKQEINNFLNYLFSLDIDYKEVSTPINNKAKQDVIKAGQNNIDDFLDNVRDTGGFDKIGLTLYKKDDRSCIVLSDLYLEYKKYCSKSNNNISFKRTSFTQHLKKLGFDNKVISLKFDYISQPKAFRCLIISKTFIQEEKEE